MTAPGPLTRRAAERTRDALLRGIVTAGELLPGMITDAERDLANAVSATRPDAQAALDIYRAAYERGEFPQVSP